MAECLNDWTCDEDFEEFFSEYPLDLFIPPPPIPAFLREELGLSDNVDDGLSTGRDDVESGQHPLSTVVGSPPNDFCHLCKWADPSFDNWTITGGGSGLDGVGQDGSLSILIIVAVISAIVGAGLVACFLRCKKSQNGATKLSGWIGVFSRNRSGNATRRNEADTVGTRPKGGMVPNTGLSLKFCNHRRSGRNLDAPGGPGSPDDFQSYSEGPYNASGATYAELNTYCEIPDRSGLSSAYGNIEDQGSNPSSAYYSDASVNSHRGGRHSPSQASVEVATICGGNHHHHHHALHHPELHGLRAIPGLQIPMHHPRNMAHHHHWLSAPRAPHCNCNRMRAARLPPTRTWVTQMGEKIGHPPPNGPPPSPPPPPLPVQRSYPHLVELHHAHHHQHHLMHQENMDDFIRRPSQRQIRETDFNNQNDQMNGSGSDSGIVVGASANHAPQPSSPTSSGTENSFLLSQGQAPSPRGVDVFDQQQQSANRPMTVINHSCMCPNHVHMIDNSQHQLGNVHLDRRCLSFVPSEYI